MPTPRLALSLVPLTLLAPVAHAQDAAPAQAATPIVTSAPDWQLRIEPRAWYVAPDGRLRMPGQAAGSAGVDFDDLNLDSARLSPAGEIAFRTGNWRFTLGGFWFSTDKTTTPSVAGPLGNITLAPGTSVDTQMDFGSLQLDAGYLIAGGQDLHATGDAGVSLVPRLEVFGGVRADWLDFRFSSAGATTERDELFLQPLAGLRGSLDIAEQFGLEVALSAGGFQSGDYQAVSWDIAAAFTWRPIQNLGMQVGYRQLQFNLENDEGVDELSYNGALAGLFFGAQLRF